MIYEATWQMPRDKTYVNTLILRCFLKVDGGREFSHISDVSQNISYNNNYITGSIIYDYKWQNYSHDVLHLQIKIKPSSLLLSDSE